MRHVVEKFSPFFSLRSLWFSSPPFPAAHFSSDFVCVLECVCLSMTVRRCVCVCVPLGWDSGGGGMRVPGDAGKGSVSGDFRWKSKDIKGPLELCL